MWLCPRSGAGDGAAARVRVLSAYRATIAHDRKRDGPLPVVLRHDSVNALCPYHISPAKSHATVTSIKSEKSGTEVSLVWTRVQRFVSEAQQICVHMHVQPGTIHAAAGRSLRLGSCVVAVLLTTSAA